MQIVKLYEYYIKKNKLNYWNGLINANIVTILADYVYFIDLNYENFSQIKKKRKFNILINELNNIRNIKFSLKKYLKNIIIFFYNLFFNFFLNTDYIQIGSREKNIKYYLKKKNSFSQFIEAKKYLLKYEDKLILNLEYEKEIDFFLNSLSKKLNLKENALKKNLFLNLKKKYIYFSSFKDVEIEGFNQKKIIFNVPKNIWNRIFAINLKINKKKKIYSFDHGALGIFAIKQKLSPYHEIRFSDKYFVNSITMKKMYESYDEFKNDNNKVKINNLNYLRFYGLDKYKENNYKNSTLLIGYPHRLESSGYPGYNYKDGSQEVLKIEKKIIKLLKSKSIEFTYQVHPERISETLYLLKDYNLKFSFKKFEEIFLNYNSIIYPSVTTSTFDIGIINKKNIIAFINNKDEYFLDKKYKYPNFHRIKWRYKNSLPNFSSKEFLKKYNNDYKNI